MYKKIRTQVIKMSTFPTFIDLWEPFTSIKVEKRINIIVFYYSVSSPFYTPVFFSISV